MCYYILFFLIINTVAFGFFPKSFPFHPVISRLIIFEIVIFVLNFIYVDAFNYYHPILVSNSLYSQYLAPYFFLPLLTAANGRILFFSHVGIRFVLSSPIIISLIDLFTFCIMLVNHSRHFFFNLGYSAGKYSTRVKHYIYFYIHFFSEALKQWVMVYWKE